MLKASGVAVTLFGNSMPLPANMPFQSAYGLANVMIACRSSTPRVTDCRRGPRRWCPAIVKALFLPLVASICDLMSSHVMGVPSLHTALGLMV